MLPAGKGGGRMFPPFLLLVAEEDRPLREDLSLFDVSDEEWGRGGEPRCEPLPLEDGCELMDE